MEENGMMCLSCEILCIAGGLTLHSLGLDNNIKLTRKKQLPAVGA